MRITEVDNYTDFISLKERWQDVLRRCDRSIFSTWEWLSIWWKHFRRDKRLLVLLAEDNGKILGIAPLMFSVHAMFGLRMGKIEFIGTPASDYSNFILVEKGEEVLNMFIDYLVNNLTEKWDYIELREIPETAESLIYLNGISGKSKLVQRRVLRAPRTNECPYLPLPKSFDVFLSRLNSKFRRDLRRYQRRLQEKFKVNFEDFSKTESYKEGMEIMFDLHQRRWRGKGHRSIFCDQKVHDFHLDVARSFSERGWLSLSSLLADGEAVASLYGFRYRSKLYAYISGMNPAYHRYGVGNLLLRQVLENCIEEELTEFDFLRGNEPYKYRWNSLTRKNFEVVLIQRGFLSWIQDWLGRKYWYVLRGLIDHENHHFLSRAIKRDVN